jgi:hypothetical protein
MKFIELYDLQEDINRLFLAGSRYAQIDSRMKHQVEFFLQSEILPNAPVNKKLATDLEEMAANPNPLKVVGKMIEISILIHSVLAANADIVPEDKEPEEKKQIPVLDVNQIRTKHSYLQLKPVMEALKFRFPNRLEILKNAFEQKLFEDIRLYPYIERSLSDPLPAVKEYIENIIVPSFNKFLTRHTDANH